MVTGRSPVHDVTRPGPAGPLDAGPDGAAPDGAAPNGAEPNGAAPAAPSEEQLDLEFDALLTAGSVRSWLQPIMELETGAPAGYEALVRGPDGHPLREPDRVFGAARRAGRLVELDALCRVRALEAALEADLRAPVVLFVNVEPAAITPAKAAALKAPPDLAAIRARGMHVVAEFTERALIDDPARLLAFADQVRAVGCGVAIDDVGADPVSLALMPLLRPDVVKLDLRLVQDRPDAVIAQTMTAVTAYAEANDAAIVAEGVETAEHERTARSLGATHGQGWYYGRPVPPESGRFARSALWRPIVPRPDQGRTAPCSPFTMASKGRTPLQGTKSLLVEVSRLLERQAAEMDGLAVVLATFEDAAHFGPPTRRRYAALARRVALVAALGRGLSSEPAPGVRGADLAPGDPLRAEWDLVVVGPHFAAALVARDCGDDGPDAERRFDYVLTYDRTVVVDTARALMRHVGPITATDW